MPRPFRRGLALGFASDFPSSFASLSSQEFQSRKDVPIRESWFPNRLRGCVALAGY
jgi:hypothetical protein